VTNAKLLVRLDAGNDDEENLRVLRKNQVAWIIQRNLRRESPSEWLEIAQAHGRCEEPRAGKEIYTGETFLERDGRPQRVVFEVIHRTVAADGQRLLVPDLEIATWWTSLTPRAASPDEVIRLYHEHGTSEQFHSELKSELDLERLPSGKFATNALMLSLGLVAYNVLRLCGQVALAEDQRLPPEQKMPLARPVFRRRLRSVIQDLMYLATRLTHHARRFGLSLWHNNPWRFVWQRLYHRFAGPPGIPTVRN
jgi:Transposase DDE domain group 1